MPDPANPQQFNRYSYVLNSPLNLTDPSGHCGADVQTITYNDTDHLGNSQTRSYTTRDETAYDNCILLRDQLEERYSINIKGEWLLSEMGILELSLEDMKNAFGLDAFLDVFSGTKVKRYREDGKTQVFFPTNLIQIRNGTFTSGVDAARWVISHEFGHRWDVKNGLSLSQDFETAMGGQTTGAGCGSALGEVFFECKYELNGGITVGLYAATDRREDFADTFATVVFGGSLPNVVASNRHEIKSDALVVAVDRIDYVNDLIQLAGP